MDGMQSFIKDNGLVWGQGRTLPCAINSNLASLDYLHRYT